MIVKIDAEIIQLSGTLFIITCIFVGSLYKVTV